MSTIKIDKSLTREETIEIYIKGELYDPVWKHYDNKKVKVGCDRYHKTNLDICVGYKSYDFCLPCSQDIARQLKREEYQEINNKFWNIDDDAGNI